MKKQFYYALVFVFACFGSSLYGSVEKNKFTQSALKSYLITRVYNESMRTIFLQKNQAKEALTLPAKYVDLATPITIPVISVKNYLQDFVFDDTCYIPENALTITTKAGDFKMWVNEDGIHAGKLETHQQLQKKERLCSHDHIDSAHNTHKFLLLIDQNGFLKIKLLRR